MFDKYGISSERQKKRQSLIDHGIDPYFDKGNRTHYIKDAVLLSDNFSVTLLGRIRNLSNRVLTIEDITGTIKVNCSKISDEKTNVILENLDVGDFIACTGKIINFKELVCKNSSIEVLTKALIDLPNEDEWDKSREKYWEHRYVDFAIRPTSVDIFKKRICLIRSIRDYLHSKGMCEIETPILRSWYDLVCYEQFKVENIQNQPLYMRLCHEDKLKQLISGGFEKVYEIGKSFRPSDSSWKHSIEFTQLETIQAYTDYWDMMNHAEEMYNTVTEATIGTKIFTTRSGNIIDIGKPWLRISVRDVILKHSGIDIYQENTAELLKDAIIRITGIDYDGHEKPTEKSGIAHSPADPISEAGILPPKPYCDWFWGLVEHCIDYFVVPQIVQPTIIYDYPVDSNWLCKRKKNQTEYIERFEAYIDGVEIANCYTLVNDAIDFIERLENQRSWYFSAFGKENYPLNEGLISAKAYGLPPMSESSFGIDRWLMLICGQDYIQDVIWMPHPYV